MANKGCCAAIREDNARFILLAIVMVMYMMCGATLFHFLEEETEKEGRERYYQTYDNFMNTYPDINKTDLDALLHAFGNATAIGLVDKRRRWDYAGAFYFVTTIVTTLGFGMTTPQTVAGKACMMMYGLVGCAGGILFFNLFLERIISFIAIVLRWYHERKQRGGIPLPTNRTTERRGSDTSHPTEDSLDNWKPSVYYVMIYLFAGAVVIACTASAVYSKMEGWTYFESLYYCFVTFATIGFGDFISVQKPHYENSLLYSIGNFLFIIIGCSCVYSLLNVISIIIKQFLNWMIKKLDCKCSHKKLPPARSKKSRRNAVQPGVSRENGNRSRISTVDSATYDSETEYGRRGSGEISMRDMLATNKVSLAVMQKQLYETANRANVDAEHHHHHHYHHATTSSISGLSGQIGPLAILNEKLGEEM